MKRKGMKRVGVMGLVLAMGIMGCGTSGQKEQKQEDITEVKAAEKKVTGNKKENVTGTVEKEDAAKEAGQKAEERKENGSGTDSSTGNSRNENIGNASVTNTSSGSHTGNGSAASSGSHTDNNSSATSGNNANSSNSNSTSNNTTAQPVHTHTWVHVDATGHDEIVTIQEAYDEEVPVYENVAHNICNQCGTDITGNEIAHNDTHLLAYEPGGWHTDWKYEQTGTQIVHHDAVTEQNWVQDNPAHDVCSGCGATK